ncbi:hypothetical protein EV138_1114 [Kribbella voronezhensis]|uniref:Uncharacterized protein n=2 Tax=Kribbella voronezhensis TaxID=2512212 RepID=A0A4R7T6R5_9ACTN|nr:hypothetical protein EV138_1114 [Kribbella voronezhensis]
MRWLGFGLKGWGSMPLLEALLALAALAGNTVVTAAVTDAWGAAKSGFARLLGRGDPEKVEAAERRLDETREQLAGATGADLERARAALEARWTTRLADLLEDDPGVEGDMRALVEQIQAQVSAADHSLAAGRDMNITGGVKMADRGGVVADNVQGSISTGNPPQPGQANV